MTTALGRQRIWVMAFIGLAGSAFGIDAPTELTVAPIDYTQTSCNIDCSARLGWTAPAGSPTGYRVYRRLAANENPTLAGEVTTTSFADSAAAVGENYLYTVTAVDAEGESAESSAVSFRKVENVVLGSKGYGSWNSYTGLNGNAPTVLNDGGTSAASGINGGGAMTYTFNAESRPKLVYARVWANDWGGTYQKFFGSLWRDNAEVANKLFGGGDASSPWTLTKNAWNGYAVGSSVANDLWNSVAYGNGSWYPIASEIEAYGYRPGALLGAPSDFAAAVANNQVELSWTAAANAASYTVWRKPDGGAWTAVESGVTACAYVDTTAERGVSYIYRVAAVSAAGDELSSVEKSALVPAGAQVWWNFLNVKSIAYPGAAAWPANPRPHYLSRDRAGTVLMAAMSTDHGGLPAMTFDLEALADGSGELLRRETDAKAWWIYGVDAYQPWQSQGYCWKGAAATDDLIFWANGTPAPSVAVVNRADDSEDVYSFRKASGSAMQFWMNGGLEAGADGDTLYSNCGTEGEKNKIYKFAINRAAKTLTVGGSFTVSGIAYIRNFAVYSVGGKEIAVFGEGEGGGKLGVLDLTTGVSTLMTASEITGKIANVKLADTKDGLYLVAQNEDGFVAVYAFDADAKTIALEKTIPAATMKALYGADGDFECRNLEMSADGRYAFVICNGGPDTRLSVIGATVKTVPEVAPQSLSVTADMSTLWQTKLSWANASGMTASGIRVFRAQTGKPGYATVADLPLGTTEYTDTAAVGGIGYTYAVAYVNSFEGKTVAGPQVTATCTPWQSLMPYKKQVVSTMYNNVSYLTEYAKAFDGDLATQCGSGFWCPVVGLQFTEPVVFGAARISAIGWAASDQYKRLDNLKLSGGGHDNVSLSGGNITGTSGLTQIAQTGSPRGDAWFSLPSANTASAWEFLVFSKSSEWYGEFREVEFYGAVESLKTAAQAKASEAEVSVAPTLSANAGKLTWTGEPNETVAVVIYRARMAEGPYRQVGEVAPGIGTFIDEEASTGVEYHYVAAYVTEYHGVNLEGVRSDSVATTKPVAVESVLLTENGTTPKTYGYPVRFANSENYHANDEYKPFDGDATTRPSWYGSSDWGKNQYVGYNFNEPVKITKAKVVAYKDGNNTWNGLSLRVSPDLAREDTNGNYLFPNNDSNNWGGKFAPTACTTLKSFSEMTDNQVWEDANLSTDWTRCAYLWMNAYNAWFGAVREFELWGYTESMWQAVQPKTVVQPVENVTARMDDTTLTLRWTLVNDAATAITVKHRVSGGAWTEIATLAGDATSLTTDAVGIGKYNEYRFEVSDDNETVWAASDFAVCPLLAKGTRTVLGCTATSAWDYLAVDSASEFAAKFTLAGSNQSGLGLTPGAGNGKYVNLVIRKNADATPAVQIQRHFVYGNTIGFYVYDGGTSYTIPWTQEGNSSTRFKIAKTGKTYQLKTGGASGALTTATTYTFTGDDHLDDGSCLVGAQVADPNLSTLSQIAPIEVKVSYPGLAIIVK